MLIFDRVQYNLLILKDEKIKKLMIMKYINIFFIVCILFIIQACTNKSSNISDTVTVIRVDLSQKTEEKNIQDIASSMTFLRLEESFEHPIGFIDKLYITSRNIYILDSQRAKSLFIYDRDGNFKRAINKVGIGPGEFTVPHNFDIQQTTGNIIILDGNQRKLIYYTQQGDFISEIKLNNTHINSFAAVRNGDIILDKGNSISDESTNYLRVVNETGNLITELLPVPEFVRKITISPFHPLQRDVDTLLFLPSMSNEIYRIYENEITLKYRIDFGRYWPSESYLKDTQGKHPLQIAQGLVKDRYVTFLNYLENNSVLHLNFYHGDKQYSFYYNKNSGKSILFYTNNENKNISFPLTTTGTTFVYVQYFMEEDRNPGLVFFDVKW